MQRKAWRRVQSEIAELSRDVVQAQTRQLLIHHMKLESTVLYWGIEVDDALEFFLAT